MIREALIASHTANGFTGQNAAIVTHLVSPPSLFTYAGTSFRLRQVSMK